MNKITLLCLLTVSFTLNADNKLIPHGEVATATGKGIVSAHYSCPTKRYAHGVLGDSIEGGCLVVLDDTGDEHRLDLPEHFVFEDVTPRIADIDNDGYNDVVSIRSDVNAGAALTVYTLSNRQLTELATTPAIGKPFRWLSPAGIADFNNDGNLDIAYVQTPHIGGILKIWSFVDSEFAQIGELSGFSNHSIGSSRVSTSKIIDFNDDGVVDLALPDQSRAEILVVSMVPTLRVIHRSMWQSDYFLE